MTKKKAEANLSTIGVERVPPEDTEDWTRIRIAGPLPMGLAGVLMSTIGNLWPEAVIETGSRSEGYALSMKVPNNPARDLDEEFLAEMRKSGEGTTEDGEWLGFDDGWVAFSPPEDLCLHLGNVAHSIMSGYPEEIINHLEWTILTGKERDDPSYVLSISRSKEQTPLAMRKAAESEVERLRDLLERHGIDPDMDAKDVG